MQQTILAVLTYCIWQAINTGKLSVASILLNSSNNRMAVERRGGEVLRWVIALKYRVNEWQLYWKNGIQGVIVSKNAGIVDSCSFIQELFSLFITVQEENWIYLLVR